MQSERAGVWKNLRQAVHASGDRPTRAAIARALAAIEAPGVRHVQLRDGLIWHGEPQLPDVAPATPTFAQWVSADTGYTGAGAPGGALVEPITAGFLQGAVSVRFIGPLHGDVAPLVGKAIVDLTSLRLSRPDQLRAAAGLTPACDATADELEQLDLAVRRLGDRGRYLVRTVPGTDSLPLMPPGAPANRNWRTWLPNGLARALSATCVLLEDPDEAMLHAPDEEVRLRALQSLVFVARTGPAAALNLLMILQQQARLN